MRTVARALAGTPHTLGTLPLGTINLFARTLGIPLDLGEAVAALAAGVDRKVDVAEVNGEIFVNNCTFGVYADLVRHRAARRTRRGRHSKIVRWTLDTGASLVRAVAAWRVLRVRIGAERRARRVPLVIVSNNEYRDGPPFSRLDSHRLAVYAPRGASRLAVAWLLARVLLLGPRRLDDLRVEVASEIEIATRRRTLLAMDGEILAPESPPRFRSLPEALCVRVPNGA